MNQLTKAIALAATLLSTAQAQTTPPAGTPQIPVAPVTQFPAIVLLPVPAGSTILSVGRLNEDTLFTLRTSASLTLLMDFYAQQLSQQGYQRRAAANDTNKATASYARGNAVLTWTAQREGPDTYQILFDFDRTSVQCQTIGEILAANPQFSTLRSALERADLLVVVNGPALYTLFAPTNAAFQRLNTNDWQALQNDKVALTRLLSYHVVKGVHDKQNVMRDSVQNTLAGRPLTLYPRGEQLRVNEALLEREIRACNGVVHQIDNVLQPGNATSTAPGTTAAASTSTPAASTAVGTVTPREGSIAWTVQRDARLSTLARLLTLTNLDVSLNDDGQYTLLAPTDNAFAQIPAAQLEALTRDRAALTQLLRYHLLPNRHAADTLGRLRQERTLQGAAISATPAGNTVRFNNATVVAADINANNGVIHLIDAVLLPPGFVLPAVR
ncbi:fasciclin domain-containing protein [Deinococcus peraridilitoris]|uniref:Secreted/surface protein with fasciclin-like repeats n=1 Tax=Deinococcus peraridilitoris (strain DSM 19664 / LMG 22246 / CIP 109416 / KR-200) TaxID=937777 RepID=L0A917_DEIPD|nr:fasciclin domain-containing protein [Deinococcus peraridilitoris]AFZ69555.1 secreted/surface protein with fasciclin-like repeats [Deinococcus peraridilitoris DSM 19664]